MIAFVTGVFTGFLSTLSLRRATAVTTLGAGSVRDFYPRSPCGERRITDGSICFDSRISIHALLAESDGPMTRGQVYYIRFLSTLSLRRATDVCLYRLSLSLFLSTLSLRRATILYLLSFVARKFLSTLSLRRATRAFCFFF